MNSSKYVYSNQYMVISVSCELITKLFCQKITCYDNETYTNFLTNIINMFFSLKLVVNDNTRHLVWHISCIDCLSMKTVSFNHEKFLGVKSIKFVFQCLVKVYSPLPIYI